jgi:hypothetical protein
MVLTHTKSGSTLQYEPLLSHNNEPSTIESILNEFKGMATTGTKIPTPITIGEFKIKLTSDKKIKYRPYRLSASERDTLKNLIQDLIDNSIIQPSRSPYASPCLLLLVKKKMDNRDSLFQSAQQR